MYLCTEDSEKRQVHFFSLFFSFFVFCFIAIPDLTLNEDPKGSWYVIIEQKWASTYLEDSICTETARWHQIHVMLLARDSVGARVQNCAPHLQSWLITQVRRELPTFMVILYKSPVKQNQTESTTNAIFFKQEVQKQSFLTLNCHLHWN